MRVIEIECGVPTGPTGEPEQRIPLLADRQGDPQRLVHDDLMGHLSTAVLLLDERLTIQYANHAAEEMLALGLPQLRHQPLASLFADDGWDEAHLRAALVERQPCTQRQVPLRVPAGGEIKVVDCIVTPVAASDGPQSTRLLVELQPLDRHLHVHREDSLVTASQATRALVRGLAHEIRNPLGGIRGAAQLLERALGNAELREYTQVIIGETDRLRELVDRMLDARRPPAFGRVNIHRVLERVRLILQAEVDAELAWVCDYDPSLPEVWADADQLIQVVLNIARNAAQSLREMAGAAAADGAPRRITVRSRVLRQFTIGSRRHPLLCMVEVQDNGPGIEQSLLETIFYPMVTGRSQGTGLGLPIAQSIMQQHGGLIECESRPGDTIFRILIPFAPLRHDADDASAGACADARG